MDLVIYGASLLAITAGITEVIKRAIGDTRFTPIVSVVVGVVLAVVTQPALPLTQSVVNGLVIGLAASGAYDLSKKSLLNK
jgi:phosphotransferase system  glucose/maltose/N-acetylglucosamine-specific IIC component